MPQLVSGAGLAVATAKCWSQEDGLREEDGCVADKFPVLSWVVLGVGGTDAVLCAQRKIEREVN